jgi:hypothetical protein
MKLITLALLITAFKASPLPPPVPATLIDYPPDGDIYLKCLKDTCSPNCNSIHINRCTKLAKQKPKDVPEQKAPDVPAQDKPSVWENAAREIAHIAQIQAQARADFWAQQAVAVQEFQAEAQTEAESFQAILIQAEKSASSQKSVAGNKKFRVTGNKKVRKVKG